MSLPLGDVGILMVIGLCGTTLAYLVISRRDL